MKRIYSFLLVTATILMAQSIAQAQLVTGNLFLQGKYLEIGSQNNGALGSKVNAPTGYNPHPGSAPYCASGTAHPLASVYDWGLDGWTVGTPNYMGDYTLPGTPWEMWCIQAGSSTGFAYATTCGFSGTGTLAGSWSSYSNVAGVATGIWNGSFVSGGLGLVKEYEVDTLGSALIVTVKMYNTTSSPITGIYYFRSSDPDNDQTWGGSFTTHNWINYQNDWDHRVMATGYPYSGVAAPYSLGTKDCRAKALIYNNWGGFSCTNLASIWGGTASCLGGSYYAAHVMHTGDIAIALVFNIGTINANDSAVISYAYIYNDSLGLDIAFPDPKMQVNGVEYDSVDTIGCYTSAGSSVPVNILHASDRCWAWSNWTWAPATGLATTTGVSNVVDMSTLSAAVTYTIVGTDTTHGNCNTKTFLLTVIPPVRFYLTNNSPLCPGDPLIVTLHDTVTSSSSTYSWSGPGGFTATTHDVYIPSCTFADSGAFIAAENNSGCVLVDTSYVIVHSTPGSPSITNPTYCQYLPTSQLTAVGSNILWYTAASGGTGSTIAPTPSSAVAGTFTYYVTQTINNCESARYPVVVTINPKPNPPVITDSPGVYCAGAPWNTFTYATGTGTVLWYASNTGGAGSLVTPVVNTSIPGIYTFWASQTLLGCEGDRSPVTIKVYDSVRAHFDTTIHWGCSGDTLYFSNTSYGATNYQWEFGDGNSSIVAAPYHIYYHQGIDTVALYAHSANCQDSLKKIYDLRHPDSSRFTLSPAIVCQNSLVNFSNSSIATLPSYLWMFGDGSTSTASTPTHTYANTGSYNIALIVKDFVPCYDTTYGTIQVDSMSPIFVSLSDTAICLGTYVTMTANFSSIGNTSLIWNLGNGDTLYNTNPASYSYTATGVYTITGTANYRACPSSHASQSVYVSAQPSINLGPDTTICSGGETVLTLTDMVNFGNSAAHWSWSTGETTSSIGVTYSGVYYCTVTIGGCTATDSVVVTDDCMLAVSNCFSPNDDGVNDYFNPRGAYSKQLKSFSM